MTIPIGASSKALRKWSRASRRAAGPLVCLCGLTGLSPPSRLLCWCGALPLPRRLDRERLTARRHLSALLEVDHDGGAHAPVPGDETAPTARHRDVDVLLLALGQRDLLATEGA